VYAKIVELQRERDTRCLYLLVYFWRYKSDYDLGRAPILINDFLMHLSPGPGVGLAIRENIRNYVRRAVRKRIRGDHSSAGAESGTALTIDGVVVRPRGARIFKQIIRNMNDPDGLLARPEVTALRDADFEVGE